MRIQREFLWGGGRKINWVRWSLVCKPKEEGGLGVRDVRVVNLSLLAKWKWRLIQGRNALWKEVLVERYGTPSEGVLEGEDYRWPVYVSRWWRDLVTLDDSNWFNSKLSRKVGNGANTSFWDVVWRGNRAFRNKYPRLFSLSNQKEANIGDLGTFDTADGNWSFSWRRPLFVWENDLLTELFADLEGFRGTLEEDVWWWRLEESGEFTMRCWRV